MEFDHKEYRTEKEIPFYEQTGAKNIFGKLKKVKNTVLLLIAYACPLMKLRIAFHRMRGVKIGKRCYLGMFCFIDNLYPEYVYIEDEVSINAGSMILTHFNPLARYKGILEPKVSPVIIKTGAIIAVRCVVLPGVKIGKNSIVSAGSVVSEDIEEYTLVRGNPAKKIARIRKAN